MKYTLIILFVASLVGCKAKEPVEAEAINTLPEGWVEDPFMECAPEEQVKEILSSTDWVLDKVEGDLEQHEIEWLQDVLYTAYTDIDLFGVRPCYTLKTYPNKNNNHLVEISDEQVFYYITRPKYFIYYLISSNRLVNHGIGDSYLYYTGKPRD